MEEMLKNTDALAEPGISRCVCFRDVTGCGLSATGLMDVCSEFQWK